MERDEEAFYAYEQARQFGYANPIIAVRSWMVLDGRIKAWSGFMTKSHGRKRGSAEGGTRTPTPFRVQRPERCVSTKFHHFGSFVYWLVYLALS